MNPRPYPEQRRKPPTTDQCSTCRVGFWTWDFLIVCPDGTVHATTDEPCGDYQDFEAKTGGIK
jgi:hypothetical protein